MKEATTGKAPLITIFIPSVHGGGAERAMIVFARELIRKGYRVDLVVTKLEGFLQDVVPEGVHLVDLDRPKTMAALPKLVRYLKAHQPRALYATIMNANVLAALAARLAGIRTPVIIRESNAPVSSPKTTISRWVTYKVAPFAYRLSDGIIAVSEGVAQQLSDMDQALRNKVKVVPTPVISEELLTQAEEPLYHPWFVHRDKPVVLSAGRLEGHKGFGVLLRAFKRMREGVDARLVVLGDGSRRHDLLLEVERLGLGKDVAFLGFKRNPFSFMKRADLFVLASEYEGLPNVIVQAMALGAPIVSTDCKTGPSEILCNGRYGRLVPVGDEEALANAMREALQEPRKDEASRYALARYGAAEATREYLSMVGLG